MIQRRAFLTGLIAAPFVYKTGLLATSQVLLRPPVTIHVMPGVYELDDISARISEILDRIANPPYVIWPDGRVDIDGTKRLQSLESARLDALLKLRGAIVS